MKTVWPWISAIALCLFVALVALGPSRTWAGEQKTDEPQTISKAAVCKIKGMESGCCLGKIESSLMKLKGVTKVELDKKAGTAMITCEKGAQVSVEEIKKAIKEADKKHDHGFEAISVKEVE
jgi:copper chaperone CopZ